MAGRKMKQSKVKSKPKSKAPPTTTTSTTAPLATKATTTKTTMRKMKEVVSSLPNKDKNTIKNKNVDDDRSNQGTIGTTSTNPNSDSDSDSDNNSDNGSESSMSVYDSGAEEDYDSDDDFEDDNNNNNDDDDDDSDDELEFEDQGSDSDNDSDDDDDGANHDINDADPDSEDELVMLKDVGAFTEDKNNNNNSNDVKSNNKKMNKKKKSKMNEVTTSINDDDTNDTSKTMTTTGTTDDDTDAQLAAEYIHTDDLSSDDEDPDGTNNRIGRIPLHWYDEHDHIGYDAHGAKVIKDNKNGTGTGSGSGDLIDKAIEHADQMANKKFVIRDTLNSKNVELTTRQIELIRRMQGGAYAHPEHNAHADHIDYFSGVDRMISGIQGRQEPKSRFKPSAYEKIQVRKLLHQLSKGEITMDYLTGKDPTNQNVSKKKKPQSQQIYYTIWNGTEEDELELRQNRPPHIAAPKLNPPPHDHSYNPPSEYLPSETDLKEWPELDVSDRPHGLLVPHKHSSLRTVGAYPHLIREHFERCLDLYLCPRLQKRRLNIDPESLIPSLPNRNDLRPFPTQKCLVYRKDFDNDDDDEDKKEMGMVRCLTVSPDGQFLASGGNDGYVRLWEVQTTHLLRSWNVGCTIRNDNDDDDDDSNNSNDDKQSTNAVTVSPVVNIQWNPNPNHHILLVGVGTRVVIIATGTGGGNSADITHTLLQNTFTGIQTDTDTKNIVQWRSLTKEINSKNEPPPLSSQSKTKHVGPILSIDTKFDIIHLKWHVKGDYFVTTNPKAAKAKAVLIHQLSKGKSQQPFSNNNSANKGGEVRCVTFHPSKPFLFVASLRHVRVYHLVKQAMVKCELYIYIFFF